MTPERLEKIKAVLDNRTNYLVPVLDNVYDPYNFAAVLRSCEAFGLQEIHIITTSEKFELERKISKGCERWLDLKFWHSHRECFDFLRSEGRLIVATALPKEGEKAFPLPELPIDKPLAIIFGNEHRGVGEESLAECDLKAYLPMYGFVESLNISAAFAASLGAFLPRLRKELPGCTLSEAQKAEILSRWLADEPNRNKRP